MPPNDHLLQTLCREQETLIQAQSILRLAQTRTGPGSGYELGPHTTGLAAICAYIASKRLNNGDVLRKTAQVASCLKASDFEKAFSIVQSAIGGSRKQSVFVGTYDTLIQRYSPSISSERMLSWTSAVERALLQSDDRFDPGNADMKCCIFFWVYIITGGKAIATKQSFVEENDIQIKTFNGLLSKIITICSTLKTRILDEMNATRGSPTKTTTSPRKSPSKPALRMLPSNDSPRKRKVEFSQPGPAQPDSIADRAFPETPTKKRKPESPVKTSLRISPSKTVFLSTASSSRVTLDASRASSMQDNAQDTTPALPFSAPFLSTPRRTKKSKIRQAAEDMMDVDNEADAYSSSETSELDELPPPRRFRPVYLDHKQWYARDPRLNRIWKQAEKYRSDLADSLSQPNLVKVGAL